MSGSRYRLLMLLGVMCFVFAAADVVFFVWLTHRMFSFWSALARAGAGAFAIGVGWRHRVR